MRHNKVKHQNIIASNRTEAHMQYGDQLPCRIGAGIGQKLHNLV